MHVHLPLSGRSVFTLAAFFLFFALATTSLTAQDCDPDITVDAGVIALADGSTETTLNIGCGSGSVATLVRPVQQRADALVGNDFNYFITDADDNILSIPFTNGPFDLSSAGEGTCKIYHIAFELNLGGVMVGGNISDFTGCFDLSEPIIVNRIAADPFNAGTIQFDDGSDEVTICAGGPVLNVEATDANITGDNTAHVYTTPSGTILHFFANSPLTDHAIDIPSGFLPAQADFYHLSYDNNTTGLAVGSNINNIGGCFDLSNPLRINTGLNAGDIRFDNRHRRMFVCIDGAEPVNVNQRLPQRVVGSNRTYVITDADGMILAVPDNNGPFDVAASGPGACRIYYVVYEDGLTGLAPGSSIDGLVGCFAITQPITTVRVQPDAGALTLASGATDTVICVDLDPAPINVVQTNPDDLAGNDFNFFVTDEDDNILAIPSDDSAPFDLSGAGVGTCKIYHIAFQTDLDNVMIGGNIADFTGCFDLSNPITVVRQGGEDCTGEVCAANASNFTFNDGTTASTICRDEFAGDFNIDLMRLMGGAEGFIRAFFILDSDGVILGNNISNGEVNSFILPATDGTYELVYFEFETSTLTNGNGGVGENIAGQIAGCSDLSDPITFTIVSGEDCPGFCPADAGTIAFAGGATDTTYCRDTYSGEFGLGPVVEDVPDGFFWVTFIIDENDIVIGVRELFVTLSYLLPAADGTYRFRHYVVELPVLSGVSIGDNINTFTADCIDRSNDITFTVVSGEGCPAACGADAGTIAFAGGATDTTYCRDTYSGEFGLGPVVVDVPDGFLRVTFIIDENDIVRGYRTPFNIIRFVLPATDGTYRFRHYVADVATGSGGDLGFNINTVTADCIDQSNDITFTVVSGADCPDGLQTDDDLQLSQRIETEGDLSVFPNPAANEITVSTHGLTAATADVKVYDQNGRLLFTEANINTNGRHRLDISRLPHGIYFLRVFAGEDVLMQRFVKE